MRALLPVLFLSGCWPYLPSPPTAEQLAGDVDGDLDGGNDPGTTDVWDSPCADGPNDLGPWNKHPLSQAGVDTRSGNYTFDAGVGPVLNKAEGASNPKAVDLTIDGAVVTAVAALTGGTVTLYAADESGTVLLYKVPMEGGSVEPGDRVRVQVTEVQNFDGVPEVTDGTVTVQNDSEKVWVEDAMDQGVVKYADYPLTLVEMWGELVTKPEECGGGMDCFDLDYGASKTIVFRTPAGSAGKGDCVHLIAPVDEYAGDTEVTMADEDWFRTF